MRRSGRRRPGWLSLLLRSVESAQALHRHLGVDPGSILPVIQRYPMRINPYYLSLIQNPQDPIWKQVVPDPRELEDPQGLEDPLEEEKHSPVPNLIHRYPDRALLIVSNRCAVYCRFCNRKRKVGKGPPVDPGTIRDALDYIRHHGEIREVLLSGGDPLLLPDEMLEGILTELRAIPHVEILRIGSRTPCTLPQRITWGLCRILKRFQPLFLITHFNHPKELTPQARAACGRLADSGIPLACQTVLLRGVNDQKEVMAELMQGLLTMRVRPYYLFQTDLVRGTAHFRTPIERGIEIVDHLRRKTSGLCVPHYVLDLPGGGGKAPLTPSCLMEVEGDHYLLVDHEGEPRSYPRETGNRIKANSRG